MALGIPGGETGTPVTGPYAVSYPAPATPGGPTVFRPGQPAPVTSYPPGTSVLDQATYQAAKADPANLKRFIQDWINKGGRGITGGDGKPASYWDVYQDLAASGIDVADLPQPDTLQGGTVKGGGSSSPMAAPKPPTAQPTAQPTGGYVPGGLMDQQTYLNAKADPANLKSFIQDWINKGGRGIVGGDGQPASYWDVYNDLAATPGFDMSGLPPPDQLPQGTIKGGGKDVALTAAAPPAPTGPADQTSPELTTLLQKFGVNYANAPAPTPGLLAFLRGLDLQYSTATDAETLAEQQAQQKAASNTALVGQQAGLSRQSLTGDLVNRNVLLSGEANTRYGNLDQDTNRRLGDIQTGLAQGIANAQMALTQAHQQIGQQATEKTMDTETQAALAKAQSDAQAEQYRQQQAAADKATSEAKAAQEKQNQFLLDMMKQGVKVA
jgi:hypothetical protein